MRGDGSNRNVYSVKKKYGDKAARRIPVIHTDVVLVLDLPRPPLILVLYTYSSRNRGLLVVTLGTLGTSTLDLGTRFVFVVKLKAKRCIPPIPLPEGRPVTVCTLHLPRE